MRGFIYLIWMGLTRKPVTTLLTFLTIVVAFLLFACLEGINAGFDRALEQQQLDFLVTVPRFPGSPLMPVSALSDIRAIPGVSGATQRSTFLATYQTPQNVVALLAVKVDEWLALRSQFRAEPSGLQKMRERRAAFVATPALMQAYGWHVGDTIPFKSAILGRDGSGVWPLELVGEFDSVAKPGSVYIGLIHYEFFDESRVEGRGTAERFIIKIDDASRSAILSKAIDRLFENSAFPTRTISEKEGAQALLRRVGDIRLITNSILAAVFFSLLCMASDVVRQVISLRLPEFAVMNAMGYTSRRLALLVLGESVVLCLVGAAAGMSLATWVPDIQLFGDVVVSISVFLKGLGWALAVGALAALLPSWTVFRSRPADILARFA